MRVHPKERKWLCLILMMVKMSLERIAKEMGLQPDEPEIIESKPAAPARARSKQDSEGQIEKLGSEALEPRRVSVPLPGIVKRMP